ncbi:PHP domain-containing protein, partial [Clostridioides sp. ES-S-0049-02]|nr:PHP domain-containing protein [Clostridioides sp. ES-S-0049-02]
YTITHIHTDRSSGTTNIDSVTKPEQYISKIANLGMKSIAFTEHGNILDWSKKKSLCEKHGIKYIHAVECYITETLDEKIRDNYHCCLYSRNLEGVKELNKLISSSYNRKDNHFYYVPRISFEELIKTSENIIVTT